jgi:hypothetical protein
MNKLKDRNPKVEGRKKAEIRTLKVARRAWLLNADDLRRGCVAVSVPQTAIFGDLAVTTSRFGLRASVFFRPSPLPSHA